MGQLSKWRELGSVRELGVSEGRWRSVGGAGAEEEAWVLPGAQCGRQHAVTCDVLWVSWEYKCHLRRPVVPLGRPFIAPHVCMLVLSLTVSAVHRPQGP